MNSYISIRSYVKCGEAYIDFFDFTGPVKDPDYIDGALELSVNGVNLIDNSICDYIDDLWSYLAEGLSIVSKGQAFKTYFPDQPIEVNLVPDNNTILVSVNCDAEVKLSVNKHDFLITMAEHAKKFFEHLKLIVPSSDKSSNLSISYLNDVLMKRH
ncbi:hypothetical protein QL189_19810 [Cronobacter turicensis]|uniref:hypothetical protein n=1 Tax=Cronobacter turicensis TaxID=413502 RepID=UPI0024A885BC|nr:hypothetical protein [Cronobacter turicensis]EKM0439326.1 hypothetical protein [Cronobacter turicensis]ELY4323842.1 hypothetical protein [Cronobacter turicensis]ELY5943999.1 hypothetical protein [Cronobacter turicensis]ELY5965364.1 hypothetical protein [Cronobacter turicensis]MDI6419630.1 hypothetical protein [Cronobacter turicensis]